MIHYVSRRFPKLTETFVVQEVLGLEAAGEDVVIDSLEAPLDEPRHPALGKVRAPIRYVPEEPTGREVLAAHAPLALRRPRTWLRLARRAKRDETWEEFRRAGLVARRTTSVRARCVHTHFAYYSADIGGMAAALAGRPFVLTAHANDIWQEHNAPHLERRLSYAAHVVTPTEYNARHLRSVAPASSVHVVPNAVDEAEPAPTPANGSILHVGRLVPKKGTDTLIRALAELATSHPKLQLEIVGEGYLEDDLRRLADESGVQSRIDFHGPQPPDFVREAYRRCAVFALPCRIAPDGDRDGLPIVLLEAMARGIPVVTTDVVGIPELVRDRETGLLVPSDNPSELAAAIGELLADRELAARVGNAGRAFVRERHTAATRVNALREVFGLRGWGRPDAPPRRPRSRRTD